MLCQYIKKKALNTILNIRPISLTCICCNALEESVLGIIMTHTTYCNLFFNIGFVILDYVKPNLLD